MEGKKQTRSTNGQLKKLTEYMSLNPAFANGEFSGPLGSRKMEAQWKDVKELLKELGPDKSIEQWKQTWRDLKRKARHANAEASAAHAITGNPVLPIPVVSDMTNIILNTIGHECSTGIGPDESGIGRTIPITTLAAEVLPSTWSSIETQENIVIAADVTEEPAGTSEMVADALQPPELAATPRARRPRQRQTRNSQNEENVPAAILNMQREQNNILKRVCDLMAEMRDEMRRQNTLREQNWLQKKRRFRR